MIYELYFSPTGGTKTVADLLGSACPGECRALDLSRPECEGEQFTAQDLCFVAMPVFGGRVPAVAVQRL